MKKQINKLSPKETKNLLLRNAKKIMSESYRTDKPELIGEKKGNK
jgi:hypothetical protein